MPDTSVILPLKPEAATPAQTLLSLKGVHKSYTRDGETKLILRDINVEIKKGELVTIVGPSGCGKSTLLNGIGGFVPFSGGDARIDGAPIGRPNRDRGIVFQDMTVPEFLTVRRNVALGLQFQRFSLLTLHPHLQKMGYEEVRLQGPRTLGASRTH